MSLYSRLNQTCVIQSQTVTQTPTGGCVSTWANGNTLPCFVSDMPESDSIKYGKFDGTLKKEFIFASDPAVSIANRILWNGISFDVLYAENLANKNRCWMVKAESLPTGQAVII